MKDIHTILPVPLCPTTFSVVCCVIATEATRMAKNEPTAKEISESERMTDGKGDTPPGTS